MFIDIERKIHDLIENGMETFYIYPFGNRGMQIYGLIQTCYDNINIIRVDNKLCKLNRNIISYEELVNAIDKEILGKGVLLISSDNPMIYQELRFAVRRDIDEKKIVDLFEWNPLVYGEDNRVSALSMAGKLIYENQVEGAVAEAGVYRGEFAKYINAVFPDRTLYLFDTFEGFVNEQVLGGKDNVIQTDTWINNLKDTAVEVVLDKMPYKEKVRIYRGIFPDTAKGIDEKFAFVNLDMDLYYPIYEGLKFFWERMSPGGSIFVHDYGNWDGVTNAVNKFCRENKVGFIWLNDRVTVAIPKPLEKNRNI